MIQFFGGLTFGRGDDDVDAGDHPRLGGLLGWLKSTSVHVDGLGQRLGGEVRGKPVGQPQVRRELRTER